MEKINIAELLRDCPQGMELNCLMYEDVYFDYVDELNIIHCYIQYETHKTSITFNQHGTPNSNIKSKCIIFPKGKNTWDGFQRPFKDGDIVFYNDTIAIFKEWGDETLFRTYITRYLCCDSLIDTNVPLFGKSVRKEIRFATEKEKAELFGAIKASGYKWNPETKTLEKLLKFKVGDRIKDTRNNSEGIIEKIDKENCTCLFDFGKFYFPITELDNFELVPNKSDITSNMEEINLDWCKQHGMTLFQVNVVSDTSYYLETNGYTVLVYTKSTTGNQRLHVINPTTKKEIEFSVSRLNRDLNKLNSITTDDLRKLCELVNLDYPFKS